MFGRMIREARERKGWSQNDLATRVGTTQQHISRMEKGETFRPNSVLLLGLSIQLELTIQDLMQAIQQDLTQNAAHVAA